ncbi:hypothetical protein FGG08_000458 [Glutinoglossum americanum]|uniref:Kinesin light chain n=1 Tax=Glutinoglossum americanum TaxID=1670608 RepID=A0A9P8L6V1_9PEZI|nr:hypothetical protein FGG08_000458 [Glutinoglossum americanum]
MMGTIQTGTALLTSQMSQHNNHRKRKSLGSLPDNSLSLKGYEKQFGPDQPDTLRTVQNLAIVYGNQSQYKEAEQLYGRALEGREKQLGSDHPDALRR